MTWLASVAMAGALVPGRALTVPPCSAENCWEHSPALTRFVAPDGLLLTPMDAQIQLAHRGGQLWIRVDSLPAAQRLEVVLDGVVHVLAEGEHAVALPDGRELFSINVRLRGPDGPRIWSPHGGAAVDDVFPMLLAEGPALDMPVELVRLDDERLVIQAPGADQLTVQAMQPDWPARRRGVPDPWQVIGGDHIDTEPPRRPGWYRVEAIWNGMDVVARRFYVHPQPTHPVDTGGIHPAPQVNLPTPDAMAALSSDSVIVITERDWMPAAELLSAELARLLGLSLSIRTRRAGAGDIVIGGVERLAADVPDAVRLQATHADGFALDIRGQMVVAASDLRGATYGVLALADALAAGVGQGRMVGDHPAVEERVLYQELNLARHGSMDVDTWNDYIRRVVLRGRYTTMYLGIRNSVQLTSQPELAHADALSVAELQAMIAQARQFGLAVYPAVSSSGHASWLTASHPELRSSNAAQSICLRNPDTAALLASVYQEIWSIFDHPEGVHIGHDEASWPANRTFGDRRDPYCAGIPDAVLLAESLRWHIDHFEDLGAAHTVAWSDMVVADWNGAQTHTALDTLSPDEVTFAAWSRVGDSHQALAARGFSVMHISTGAYDWKRADPTEAAALDGVGLAVFPPFPWMLSEDTPSSRGLSAHWSHVLLSGATAWQPELATDPLATQLSAVAGLPAYQPGYRAVDATWHPVVAVGAASAVPHHAVTFETPPALATVDAPASIAVDRRVNVLSLLQAVEISVGARQRLQTTGRTLETCPPALHVRFWYQDGGVAVTGLRHGVETADLRADPALTSLWGTAGSERVGMGGRAWRVHIQNPHPDRTVHRVEVVPAQQGVQAWVVDAAVQ